MSRFLAPIHFWLYNKVKYHEDLEVTLKDELIDSFGAEVENIYTESCREYGQPLGDTELESVIDQGNIHGWLSNTIAVAETRQADFIGKIVTKYREDSLLTIERVHRQVGKKYGQEAKEEVEDPIVAETIYNALNDYILDGMPCDNVRQVVLKEQDKLEFIQTQCLHSGYWDRVGLDQALMYKFRADWIEGFVTAISDGEYGYSFQVENLKHTIEKNK